MSNLALSVTMPLGSRAAAVYILDLQSRAGYRLAGRRNHSFEAGEKAQMGDTPRGVLPRRPDSAVRRAGLVTPRLGVRAQPTARNAAGPGCDTSQPITGGSRPFFLVKTVRLATDLLGVVVAMAGATLFHHSLPSEATAGSQTGLLVVGAASLPVWVGFLVHYRLYNDHYLSSRLLEFRRLVHATGASVMTIAAVGSVITVYIPRSWLVLTFALGVLALTITRDVARRGLASMRASGRLQRAVAIVGANEQGRDLARMMSEAHAPRHRVVGFIDDDLPTGAAVDGLPILGSVASSVATLRRHGIDSVLIAATPLDLQSSSRLAFDLTAANLHVQICTGLCDVAPTRLTVDRIGRIPMLYVEPVRLGGWRGIAKRCFDVVGASVSLVVAAPVLAVAALAIKIDSPGPVLFRQRRVGLDGNDFEILKLRSMVLDAEARISNLWDQNEVDGPLFKMREDPRITRVGRVLRLLSIDEIPQLWNVMRGEMSLVGPRPALASEVAGWSSELHDRLSVRPGITGMWQVSGRSDASFEEYTRLDLYYVHNWSLLIDLVMLAKTIPAVLSRRGSG